MSAGASAGSGSAEAPVRRMTAGAGKYLIYQVYTDVARGTVWGNTAPTGVALTGTGVSQTLTAYGSVLPAQLVAQGFTLTSSASQLLTDADTNSDIVYSLYKKLITR